MYWVGWSASKGQWSLWKYQYDPDSGYWVYAGDTSATFAMDGPDLTLTLVPSEDGFPENTDIEFHLQSEHDIESTAVGDATDWAAFRIVNPDQRKACEARN